MMGATHALGGAAALAGYTLITGQTDAVPIWGYAVAAGAALIPDADNHEGTILNRKHLLPLKFATYPVWMGRPSHRGRTHSLFGIATFAAVVVAWVWLINLLVQLGNPETQLPLLIIATSAIVGYISHIVLDMLNIPGVMLFWPLPLKVFFPPWRAYGFIPGRFNADSRWSHTLVHLPMTAFMAWFMIDHAGQIGGATVNDSTIFDLAGGIVAGMAQLIGALLRLAGG